MARKKSRRARKPSGFTRCKYVGKRGSKRVANRLAGELRRDGYRAEVMPGQGGVRGGYDVYSCGRLAKKPARRRRR